MSRAIPDLTQGFTGVSLPKTGPRQMGTDADGRTSVITFLNMVTESIESMHDNQTNVRPDYLPINGLWCYTAPDGAKTVYQYTGETDVVVWSVGTNGKISSGAKTDTLGQVSILTATEIKTKQLSSGKPTPAVADLAGLVTLLGTANMSQALTVSGNFTPTKTTLHKVTIIGGGGAGGSVSGNSTTPKGGGKGGNTTFNDVTASGGSGGGSSRYGGGGGGEAGQVVEVLMYLVAGTSYAATIGAGGQPSASTAATQGDGEGNHAGKGVTGGTYVGGGGADGAGVGQSQVGHVSGTAANEAMANGGNGGQNHFLYGGGGGGNCGFYGGSINGGIPGNGGANGITPTASSSSSVVNNGGAGGAGAVIIEWND